MKKKVSIVGGGTAGLFAAAFLDTKKYEVTIYEKKNSLGRKFLVAGDGGFNLSHSEELESFIQRYTPNDFLESALRQFSNTDLKNWLEEIGIPTFIGSSGKIFPARGIKPIEVLKTIEKHLSAKGVQFKFKAKFTDWDQDNNLIFDQNKMVVADIVVFALGGASWKVTGSDGTWLEAFKNKDIGTKAFRSSNCAYQHDWPIAFLKKHEGRPLKNIAIHLDGKTQVGEAVITSFGIEGNAIYGLSPEIQAKLESQKEVMVYLDMKPQVEQATLIKKLTDSKSNLTTSLKEDLKLDRAFVDLIKQVLTKEEFLDAQRLTNFIKNFPLKIISAADIDEAISTSGGVALNAVDSNFQLCGLGNQYAIGEMLDWDAPTGGYLIQACASMGVQLARHLNEK